MQTEREKLDLWHEPIVGSLGQVLCGSLAKYRLLNLNQKSWVLQVEVGGGGISQGLGRQGKLLITRAIGKLDQELTFACDTMKCHLGYSRIGESSISARTLQAFWPNKMDSKAESFYTFRCEEKM